MLTTAHHSPHPALDDEIEFPCPNCGTVIGASEARRISIGCIVRTAVLTERTQRRALQGALSNDKSDIPPISQEAMGEIFTPTSPRYTYFPPILTSLKFTLPEMQQRPALLKKVVRTCTACFERFVDDEEMRRQLREDMARLRGNGHAGGGGGARPPTSPRAPQRLEPLPSPFGGCKAPDRRTDMAFTNLQVSQRASSRALRNKQTVRERLLHSIGGNTDALAIDWEVVPQMAAREMRRTANQLSEKGMGAGSGGPSSGGGGAVGGGATAAHSGGDVIFRRGRNTAPPPLSFLGLGESPITAFDVPFEVRLMADLFAKVSGACEEFATADPTGAAVPVAHPLYAVYRHGANRLPPPPVPFVHSELPHPLAGAPIAKQHAMPSAVRALEDAPVLAAARKASVDRAVRGLGWGIFTPVEMAMLADVLADPSIVVESDEDDEEEEEEDESDYDSDEWREDGGMYY